MAQIDVYYDNLFCFMCRSKMVEVVPYKAYQCPCGLRSTDAIVEAQILAGWALCPRCLGDKCADCSWLGVILPIPQEG